MRLVVGLGNPGSRYQHTRHNIGFMAVDAIARRHNFSAPQEKFHGLLREGRVNGNKLFLFQPMTFMNRSGEPLQALCHFYKIPPEAVIVLFDELALPVGKLKVKQGGGNNGHNGLKSIDSHVGLNYWRVRLGIDHPGDKSRVADYVLSNFRNEEIPDIEKLCDAVAVHIGLLLGGNAPEFMNRITLAMR